MVEIAKIAFRGMQSDELEVAQICLEKIFFMITEDLTEEAAAKKMNTRQSNKIKADDKMGKRLTQKYGKFKGFSKFKLAIDYFQMSNDRFFEIYGFNFVPRGKLYDIAKAYISHRQQLLEISACGSQLVSGSLNSAITVPNGYVDTADIAKRLKREVGIQNSFKLGV